MAKVSSPVYIGIDGGGSRTRGILYHGSKELAQAETGTARVGSVGVVESSERLLNLINELCIHAGITPQDIDAVTIGLAGVWLREEEVRSKQLLQLFARERKMEFDYLTVTSDAAIALEGAFKGSSGIVLIVGTGTIAVGKTTKGDIVRCGGWGVELSDEGSGAWIGREALTAVAHAFDGRGKQTAFADMLVHLFPSINPNQPRTFVAAYNERVFDYPSVVPMVFQCAEQGDDVCNDIIARAADHLMHMLDVLYRRYYADEQTVAVACVGGIMEADTKLAALIAERLKQHEHLKQASLKGTPLDGAIALARKALQADVDD